MESSDDQFAWTSASSNSVTSDSDSKDDNMSATVHTKVEDGDTTDNKKKLQKRLFAEEPGSDGEEPPRKRKKLKREREKTSPRIKCEPESDAEAELAYCVKQEQVSDQATAAGTNGTNHDAAPISESDTFTNNDRKSKKSKRRNRNTSLNTDVKDMFVEDMFSAEETVVEERHRKPSQDLSQRKLRKSISKDNGISHTYEENGISDTYEENVINYTKEDMGNHDSSSNNEITERKKKKKKKKRKRESESQEIEEIVSETDATNGHTQETSFQSTKSSNRKSLLSDRIQYEEDVVAPAENQNTTIDHPANIKTQSTRLKRFIKSKPSLKPVTPSGGSNSLITGDDEVWVVKCPHEFDISNLRGKDLNLDTKCKLKIDGKTFEGNLNDESGTAAILSCANNQIVTNNVSVLGTVTFRKRIPKPHAVEDNVIQNNQTNFIPLPDTKCRHPLFGSDYKKAMKIPSAIKERLKGATEPQQVVLEKKKKKRHREEEPEPEVHEMHKKKKHLQMSVEEDDAPPRKKSKKIKMEVSADTWESEKAIEESLFNF